MTRAAVIILRSRNRKLLLVKRASRKGDPWSGDVALPGGVRQAEDSTILDTALRELYEETGIHRSMIKGPVTRLSDRVTRTHRNNRPMVVTPYVFHCDQELEVTLSEELAGSLWLEEHALQDDAFKEKIIWRVRRIPLKLPAIRYQEHTIWGLTYSILQEWTRFKRVT